MMLYNVIAPLFLNNYIVLSFGLFHLYSMFLSAHFFSSPRRDTRDDSAGLSDVAELSRNMQSAFASYRLLLHIYVL